MLRSRETINPCQKSEMMVRITYLSKSLELVLNENRLQSHLSEPQQKQSIYGFWVIPVEEKEREKKREKKERERKRKKRGRDYLLCMRERSVDMMLMDAATKRTEARI